MAEKNGRGKIFALLGAATGLGNALRFPGLCACYGGAFVIAYAVSLVFICFPLLCEELYFGKRRGDGKWEAIVFTAALNSALVALYYGSISFKLVSAGINFLVYGNAEGPFDRSLGAVITVAVWAVVWLLLKGGAPALSRSGKLTVTLFIFTFGALAAFGAVNGCNRLARLFAFAPSAFARGSLWAEALGQALLALSLAAGVMPSFASGDGNLSPVRTAAKIVVCNFAGCLLSLAATLPFVPEGRTTEWLGAAFTVYPSLLRALPVGSGALRISGAALYAVLSAVSVQSLCSLALPLANFFGGTKKFSLLTALCLSGAALTPAFVSGGCMLMCALDRMACSVNALIVAFAESIYFASRRNVKGVAALALRVVCPISCGFLALFSLCGARFSCFSPPSALCAYLCCVSVFSGGACFALRRRIKAPQKS